MPADNYSVLIECLDDGQEVKIYKAMGTEHGYTTQIYGDMFLESTHPESLNAAIKDVAEKYKKWKSKTH